jgi:hypothetical protein
MISERKMIKVCLTLKTKLSKKLNVLVDDSKILLGHGLGVDCVGLAEHTLVDIAVREMKVSGTQRIPLKVFEKHSFRLNELLLLFQSRNICLGEDAERGHIVGLLLEFCCTRNPEKSAGSSGIHYAEAALAHMPARGSTVKAWIHTKGQGWRTCNEDTRCCDKLVTLPGNISVLTEKSVEVVQGTVDRHVLQLQVLAHVDDERDEELAITHVLVLRIVLRIELL